MSLHDKIMNLFSPSKDKNNTLNISTSETKIIQIKPKSFIDGKNISKELLKGNIVWINISDVSNTEAIRIVDFLTGVLLVTKGTYKKASKKEYILFPTEKHLLKYEELKSNQS